MTTWQQRMALQEGRYGRRITRPVVHDEQPAPVISTGIVARRYTPLVIHLWFLILVLVLWLAGLAPAMLLYISGSVAMVVYLTLAVIEFRRAPLFVSPLSALFAWYFPPMGPCAIHYANIISDGEPILFSVRILHPDDLAAGYVIMAVGNVALHAGLQWARPLVDQVTKSNFEYRPRLDGLFVLWCISMTFRLAPGALASLGAIAGVMHFGSTTALAAFLLSRDPNKRNGFFWLFVTNLNSGSKAYLMFSFLPFLWLFLRDAKLRRFVPALSVAMVTLYFSVIAPVVMASRSGNVDTRESAMTRIMRTYSRGGYEDDAGADKQLPKYLERAFDATATGCIYGEVQRTGFMYGEGMEYMFSAFIPRILWPDKPTVTRGAWFSEYLGQARTEESATTSLGQSAAGELYWNFGWPGIVAGMVFLGAVVGKMWRIATPFAERHSMRLLLYFWITFQMTSMAECGSVLLALIYRIIVLGLAIYLVDRVWSPLPMPRRVHPALR
jgi:hypothetical protein